MLTIRGRMIAAGAVIAATVWLGPPAGADARLESTGAQPGEAVDVTFQVRDDRPALTTTRVQVLFPPGTPIAEVYPLSVPDWAPVTASRDLDHPVEGIHGSALTTATTAITWTRTDEAPDAPEVDLRVALGPLPAVPELVFTVVQTYSDGSSRRWNGPATTLRVRPGEAPGEVAPAGRAGLVAPAGDRPGTPLGLIGLGVVAGLLLGVASAAAVAARSRTRWTD